jgi:5'-nucleotidase
MKAYQWILFDADETLFHFDAFRGLQVMLQQYRMDFSQTDYHEYQLLNQTLWGHYQQGLITAAQLQCQRFEVLGDKLNVAPQQLNRNFLCAMAEICEPLMGAASLLNTLKDKCKLGIITNGFTELQEIRLQRVGYRHYFDVLIISEQVGVAKPHLDIFTHALEIMGKPLGDNVLMVGDNLESDIKGGLNAGLDTCWFNPHNKPKSDDIQPHYQVTSLTELETLLRQQFK